MPAAPAGSPALLTPAGVFTTLHDSAGRLRGCIGFIEARRTLWETVWITAADAATQDPRFDPVTAEEIPALRLEISILSPLRKARPEEVKPGVHGVVLSRGLQRGLLLPQVATEQGWDAETFLEACCDKARLPRGSWRDSAKLEIFTAEVLTE